MHASVRSSGWLGPVAPLAVAAFLFCARLQCPLLEPEESRYAEIPRQMLEANQFLIPTLDGQGYLDKPPLLYWLVMASYRVFGVHDWAARLVAGLAAILTVGAVYWWGRRTSGPLVAFAGAMILALSGEFVYRGRMITMNGLLALWVTISLAAGHLALQAPRVRRGLWLIAGVACGLGIMTKGLVAIVLVGAPLIAAPWLDRRLSRPTLRAWAAFAAVAVVVAAPWFIAVAARDPGFVEYFFWKHHVERFVNPFDHAKPFWFYLPGLLLGMLPWTLLIPGVVRQSLRPTGDGPIGRSGLLRVCGCAAICGLLFFSASGCKRAVYLVPVLPPLSLCLGCYLAERFACCERQRSVQRLWVLMGTGTFAVLAAGVLCFLPRYAKQFSLAEALHSREMRALSQQLPVYCCPHTWSSVGFYLDANEVKTLDPEPSPAVWKELGKSGAVLIVKSGADWERLRHAVPPYLQMTVHRQTHTVTVATVSPLSQAARRDTSGGARIGD